MTSLTDHADSTDTRGCSCHPDDAITPCPKQHALWHCQHEAVLRGTHKIVPADFVDKRIEAERKLIAEWLLKVYHEEKALGCKPIVLQTILDMGVAIEHGEYRTKETKE